MDAISPFTYATTQRPANPAIASERNAPDTTSRARHGGFAGFAETIDDLGRAAQRADEMLTKAAGAHHAALPRNALGQIGFALNTAGELANAFAGAPPAPPPPPAAQAPENATGPGAPHRAYGEITRLQ